MIKMTNKESRPTADPAISEEPEPVLVNRFRTTSEAEHAAAIAELCFLMSPQHQKAYAEAKRAVPDAIKQLMSNERGEHALIDFRALLENGGNGLDDKNWVALEALFLRRDQPVVQAAMKQLRGSERGSQALKDFTKLIQNEGLGLDSKNSDALAAICRAGGYLGES